MGHHSCCNNQKVRRGLWSPEEDEKLVNYISTNGHGCWNSVPRLAGLKRCGKSCRLRWINYLRPDLKRGNFSPQEESLIIELHRVLGNRWARIAKHLPGRTDNEVKNFWNSSIKKKLISQGAADLAVPDSSIRIASNEDLHSLNANPNPMVPSQDHIFLPSTTSMVHALGNEDLKMDVINYNLDWVGAPKSLGTSAYDPTRSFDHHHQDRNYQHHHQRLQVDYQCPGMYVNETAPPYHTHAKFLDAKFILPQDPQVVAPLTATLGLDEIVEGGECAMPSSSMTHEVNPCARVPFFPFGSYPYDPHVTMDYMDAVTASSSSSCGYFQVDYQCPSMYVNETVPAHHTQAKFLDAKFMLPQDLSAVAPLTAMPRLYENVEGGKCAMPSSSMTHEVDQCSRVPCYPFGFYTYDPHVTMDVVMASSSSSSSSSSCGHFQVDNQYPSIYVNETAPPYHTQAKFLDAKFVLPQDPQAVVPLTATPRLSKIIEGDECAMPSSSITHEVDPFARVPCLPFGSWPYDLHMTMD